MHTQETLQNDLQKLGVPKGAALIVHSSYKSLGAVEGGPGAVIGALRESLGSEGTLLAPAFTTNLIDPYTWPTPPAEEERQRLMREMPLFSKERSEPYKMGAIPKTLWRTPGAVRSDHPVTSWVALGRVAEALTKNHPIEDPEGIEGPVGRVYQRDGWVLLLGVGHDANTTIHLAESLLEMPHLVVLPDRFPVENKRGEREWREVQKTTKCSDGFVKLGPWLKGSADIKEGRVGDAESLLLRSFDIVQVAREVLTQQPTALLCDDPECVHCPTSRKVLEFWR